ncbi:MAG: hypothetical protein DWH82_11260 [Planctomycetota bacterium]|nr:MAG: hypothetical protein DWH82_11260 [Planctomycetota bacterium]
MPRPVDTNPSERPDQALTDDAPCEKNRELPAWPAFPLPPQEVFENPDVASPQITPVAPNWIKKDPPG